MIHLRSVHYRKPAGPEAGSFPFSVPVIQALTEIEFTAPVTFFVGENGSGKSTLLEALASAAGSVNAGSAGGEADPTLAAARRLGRQLRLAWHRKKQRGFFLRAEDFFGYVRRMNQMRQEMVNDLESLETEYRGRSQTALGLARMPFLRELHDMERRYGADLDAYSHGEIFLKFIQARAVPQGLYLLDEPETPLSPLRQLAFLSALKQMVEQDSQFVIATHSPILLAFPGAAIYSFDQTPVRQTAYDDLEHVRLTRDFLNHPEQFLRHL